MQWRGVHSVVCRSVCLSVNFCANRFFWQMAGSPPNLHTMDSRSACIQGVLKVKVEVKGHGHVIRALFWNLGMSCTVVDGLVWPLPLYLWNGARWGQSCYWPLIGICKSAFDWYQNRWPWMTWKGNNALCYIVRLHFGAISKIRMKIDPVIRKS